MKTLTPEEIHKKLNTPEGRKELGEMMVEPIKRALGLISGDRAFSKPIKQKPNPKGQGRNNMKKQCLICKKKKHEDNVIGLLPKFRPFNPKNAHRNDLPSLKMYFVDLDSEFEKCKQYICVSCCNKLFETDLV